MKECAEKYKVSTFYYTLLIRNPETMFKYTPDQSGCSYIKTIMVVTVTEGYNPYLFKASFRPNLGEHLR